MACLVELKMPPRSTSTWSSWTSLVAAAAACASSLALSSISSCRRRPSRPPDALISSATSVAVLAWAPPRGERAPVWSAITPTLIASRMTSLLRLVAAADLRHLRPALVPSLLHDRRDIRVGGEALPAVEIPVEDDPDPVGLVRVAEHERALRAVLLALLGTLGGEDTREAVEVLDRGRCQEHPGPPYVSGVSKRRRGWHEYAVGALDAHRAIALCGTWLQNTSSLRPPGPGRVAPG